jgi:hypothetical protein
MDWRNDLRQAIWEGIDKGYTPETIREVVEHLIRRYTPRAAEENTNATN